MGTIDLEFEIRLYLPKDNRMQTTYYVQINSAYNGLKVETIQMDTNGYIVFGTVTQNNCLT